jgi:hypothetical protein
LFVDLVRVFWVETIKVFGEGFEMLVKFGVGDDLLKFFISAYVRVALSAKHERHLL